MIPQISGIARINQIEIKPHPSFTYGLMDMQIVGDVDGIAAIQQAVFHILSTERYAYIIYDDNYGAELEKYIGRPFAYLETTIEATLRDALLQDDRIIGVNVNSITKTGISSALVVFTVISNRGTFGMEAQINGWI